MNKENLNIELIKDYFAGKLDAKAMHALEKCALEDPFLAEAMEGFHEHPDNISQGLNDLQARLENRVYKKSFMLKPWLVAASVLLILGVGTYFIINNQNKKTGIAANEIVQNALSEQSNTKKLDTQNIVSDRLDTGHSMSNNALQKNKKRIDTIKNELAIADKNNYSSENTAITSVPKMKNKVFAAPVMSDVQTDTSIAFELEHQISSLDILPANYRKVQIIDSVTGNPVIGATITTGKNIATIADQRGFVSLEDSLQNVHISAVGYDTKTVALNNGVVKLSPAKTNLNDVVVVGYGIQKKEMLTGAVAGVSVTKNNPSSANIYIRGNAALNHAPPLILIDGSPDSLNAVSPQDIASVNVLKGADATALYGTRGANGVLLIATKNRDANNLSFKKSKNNTLLSQPQTGWDKFNDYIKSTVKDLDSTGAKGTVMLSFSVLPDGHLTGFKIIKGLSEERNQQAIDILKNGDLWTYDAKSHKGFYTIEF